jgi:hypothetical protein
MTETKAKMVAANMPLPTECFVVTLFLTVRSVARLRAFHRDVLGGQVVLDENPCMIKLANSWIIMNLGGGPTPDKPNLSLVNYEPDDTVSSLPLQDGADHVGANGRQTGTFGSAPVSSPADGDTRHDDRQHRAPQRSAPPSLFQSGLFHGFHGLRQRYGSLPVPRSETEAPASPGNQERLTIRPRSRMCLR